MKNIKQKDQALEYCIEIYKDYTREQILNFSSSIQRAWKLGKRASVPKIPGFEISGVIEDEIESIDFNK